MIFIGPTLRSGIGQHCSKYCKLFPGSKYYHFGEDIPECDYGLVFLIPTQPTLDLIPYMKSRVKNLSCMTVCETATVHEDYGKICDEFETIFVPSRSRFLDAMDVRIDVVPSSHWADQGF